MFATATVSVPEFPIPSALAMTVVIIMVRRKSRRPRPD
jgi:hypothetical protein